MKTKKRKIVIRVLSGVLAVALVAGAVVGVRTLRGNSGAVAVYALNNITYTGDNMGLGTEMTGTVSSDQVQTVYISDTQTVTEVYVTEGQQVKVGDPLIAYDTTLTDIELTRKDLDIQKKEIEYDNLATQVKTGKRTSAPPEEGSEASEASHTSESSETEETSKTPETSETPETSKIPETSETPETSKTPETSETPETSKTPEASELPEETANVVDGVVQSYYVVQGEGTETSPKFVILAEDCEINDELLNKLELNSGKNYLIFVTTEDNKVKGDVLTKYGLVCNKKSDEKYSFSFFDASAFSYTTSSSVSTVDGIAGDSYSGDYTTSDRLTAAEIAELKTQMKDLDLEIRVAKNELAQMQKEADNGQVLATVAGTVSSVQDADEARSGGTPMIKVTGTGGYTIECTVDELSRDDLSIGEEVEVTSYDSGMQYTGTISTIGDMPVTSQYYYYGTSSNTSYYTFTVTVSSDADFSDNEYVSVTTNGSGDSSESGFYLESMFILTEGSKSYVYVRGENNKLEKRQVKTGTISYGSVEILSGLDRDTDWVAFPYGTSIKDGAATREATLDELYSY